MLRKAADVPYPSGSSCGSRIYLSLFIQSHYRDLVDPAARQIEPAITCCYHVAHHPASRGNRLRTETFRLAIKSDQRVRLYAGLAVPALAIARGRNAVGMGVPSAG